MSIRRRRVLLLALTVLAVALLLGFYLWFQAAMRVPGLPTPVPRKEVATRTNDQSGSLKPGATCFDSVRNMEVPCPVSDPLVEATRSDDVSEVERLLRRRTSRKVLNEALFAISTSSMLVIDIIGREEVKPDEAHGFHYAEIAKLLLAKGASLEARDRGGSTPLIAAASYGEDDVVKLLLEKGADIEAADNGGQTALIGAACNCPIIDMADTYDSVKLLLDAGADIEARDKRGRTALMAAAAWGRNQHARLLLDRGAHIDDRDNQGNTALLIASSGSAYPTADAVKLLLTRGADVDARNDNGDTPLILAASHGGYEDARIVGMLLSHGADLQARNKQGHTALELARKNGRTQIAALLRSVPPKAP